MAASRTSTLPPLRVEPELRAAAEAVLNEGETLSAFMETSVRRSIQYRKMQQDFLARAKRSLEEVENGGKTYSAEEVLAELEEIIAREQAQQRP